MKVGEFKKDMWIVALATWSIWMTVGIVVISAQRNCLKSECIRLGYGEMVEGKFVLKETK